MNVYLFEEWKKDETIDKLIFNNDRIVQTNGDIYGLLSIPKLDFTNNLTDTDANPKIPYKSHTKGLDYSANLKIKLPSLDLYKIVVLKSKNTRNYTCLYDASNPFISKENSPENISAFFKSLLEICESEFQKLYRITLEIKSQATYIDFFYSLSID
jgi:hypothetical protein